mmetsp:Transcript_18528/g.37665  ORF Transcript_18528/g.37665 Transcript_18528/m.37665 type:complete len:210 (+) Transcript_18528:120-749(+)
MSETRRRPFKRDNYNRHNDDDGDTQQSQNQRRRNAAISLNSFSSKKGHDRALQEYKKRKDQKFQKNAALLREYQRAMKQEGYDAGKGASRKRDRDGEDRSGNAEKSAADDNSEEAENHQKSVESTRKKRHKSDPLYQARKQAEIRKQQQLEDISERKGNQQNEGKKQHLRKVRAKKMMQRTKRGQPLMKNVIGDLLGKIRGDIADEGVC